MSGFTKITLAAAIAFGSAAALQAQEGSLSIAVGFGPTAEVPDPRAGYNGWMSNQTGVTETLMGIDYEMNLYPRLAREIAQIDPTTWRVSLRDGVRFHDGTPVTAAAVITSIKGILDEGHPGHNARVAKLLDLADMLSPTGPRSPF
jgi:peptide/nickel transport system substrate-binding protein